jgi:hypothetical protein
MLADQLTIVVVTYNSMEALPSFFQRVTDATAGEPCRILVCDNGSEDGVEDFVGRQSGEISFLGSRTNEGYGAALNRGIVAATTPFVALMNPDVAIQPGGYRELVRFMAERPRAAGASGVVVHVREYPSSFVRDRLFPRGQVAVHFGLENVLTRLSFYSGLQTKFSHRPWLVSWSTVPARDEISVGALNGCFGVFRRDALFEVGLFDPRLFLYFEESDLSLRLRTRGYELYVTARTVVVHRSGTGSAATRSRTTELILLNSQYLFFRKHYGRGYTWAAFFAIWAVITVGVAYRAVVRGGRGSLSHLWTWHLRSLLCGGGTPAGTIPGPGKDGVNYDWSAPIVPRAT